MSTFDVVVIGGGPAGMMAAARAAQYGARTVLIEKNRELGRKLMITGRGRCNFAHAQNDPELLAKDYRHGGDFLLPALQKFGTKETVAFFLRRGVVAEEERGHRLYPREGQDASSVVNALWTALKDGGVHVLRGHDVRALDTLGGKVRRAITAREEIDGRVFIIATGGLSFPNTGSTGDGYRWARKAGHTVTETEPALCPVKIAQHFDDSLHGLKLKNVRVILKENGKKTDERFGEMDFTPFGVSGAIIMDMAAAVGEALKRNTSVTLHIDLKPALDPERLDARINRDFEEFSGDALRFAVRKLLPKELIPEVLKAARLDMGKPCGQTTPEERLALRNILKDFVVTPTELLGFRHAIITRGGVATTEIDPHTMRSLQLPNLYFAGEVIDIDGPTGGYNLQECWSTGFIAGSAAAASLGFTEPTDVQIVEQMEEARLRRYEREKEERRLWDGQSTAPGSDIDKNREENDEDMTIQTGPVDDREFCGWKDPRKENNKTTEWTTGRSRDRSSPSIKTFPGDERDKDMPSRRRERDFDERPLRPRFERRDDERPSRPRYERYDDERAPRRERVFDDRPQRSRFERRDDDRSSRPRYERYEDDRAPRRERVFDDRPQRSRFERRDNDRSSRPRYERFEEDRAPRRERVFDDRPQRSRFERRDDDRSSRPRYERIEEDRAPRHERNFDERPQRPRFERREDERPSQMRHGRYDDERTPHRDREPGDRPTRQYHDDRENRRASYSDEGRPPRTSYRGDRDARPFRRSDSRPDMRNEGEKNSKTFTRRFSSFDKSDKDEN